MRSSSLVADVRKLERQRRELVAKAVDAPADAELNPVAVAGGVGAVVAAGMVIRTCMVGCHFSVNFLAPYSVSPLLAPESIEPGRVAHDKLELLIVQERPLNTER